MPLGDENDTSEQGKNPKSSRGVPLVTRFWLRSLDDMIDENAGLQGSHSVHLEATFRADTYSAALTACCSGMAY